MSIYLRRFGVLLAITLIPGVLCSESGAQFRTIPSAQFPINPMFRVAPGLTQQQYLFNLASTAHAVQQFPPWAFGGPSLFPYAANNPGGTFGLSGFNPYFGFNPYTSGFGYSNPYVGGSAISGGGYGGGGLGGSSGYGGYFSYIPPAGYYLMGAAQVMNAYPNVIKGNWEARLLREQGYQARIETAKKRFEYELYVRANTPTYTDQQSKIYKTVLRRIQRTANPTEIWSGKSLNILRDDLGTAKPASVDPIPLTEETLKHINVTRKLSGANLGLLRNEGGFTWPTALQDENLLPENERKAIEAKARHLLLVASNGDVPANLLRDLGVTVANLRDKLGKMVNDIPAPDYMEAKRFLNDLDAARLALQQKDTIPYLKFQRWASGPKTVQELTAYLVQEGLYFAPAVQGDEAAYQAMHAALAAYDMAVHAQYVAAAPAAKEEPH